MEQRIKKLTIDHKIPISKWEEYKKLNNLKYECNDIENIQPMCSSCNARKHNKIIAPLVRDRG